MNRTQTAAVSATAGASVAALLVASVYVVGWYIDYRATRGVAAVDWTRA